MGRLVSWRFRALAPLLALLLGLSHGKNSWTEIYGNSASDFTAMLLPTFMPIPPTSTGVTMTSQSSPLLSPTMDAVPVNTHTSIPNVLNTSSNTVLTPSLLMQRTSAVITTSNPSSTSEVTSDHLSSTPSSTVLPTSRASTTTISTVPSPTSEVSPSPSASPTGLPSPTPTEMIPSSVTIHTATTSAFTSPSSTGTATTRDTVNSSPVLFQSTTPETDPTAPQTTHTPSPSSSVVPSDTGEGFFETIQQFISENVNNDNPAVLAAVVLVPVIVILLSVFGICCCVFCCVCCTRRKQKRFDIAQNQTHTSTTRNGISPTYRPRSRTSLHEMKYMDTDNFYSDFPFTSASQPYHSTIALSDPAFEHLPSISPMSYPSQMMNYMNPPERGEHPSSPPPRISLSESPGRLRKFPGSSPSLHRPTPLGQQLQKQAERNSTQGSRNSIQGSRGSISALGSRTSFSGSFLSSNNAMSRDEIRASGYLLRSSKTMSEHGGSQTSLQPLMKQRSLDVVPTRESPVPLPSQKKDSMCIPNPLAFQREEDREEGDGEDENDLCTDPLGPIMTSTPTTDDLPTKEERQPKVNQNSKPDELVSPRKKSLQQLTSLGREEEAASTAAAPDSSEVTGGSEEGSIPKEEKPRPKPMSRLEKLTSLDYIRSSIRRSLKKKRVKFLSTPDSTPKAKKKNPPHNLSVDLTPDPLTFSNQEAINSEEHDISSRIQTPSPISPEFETVDDYPQQRPYNLDIYPETPSLRHPFPGGGRGATGGGATRMRAYSDMPMFAPQLSQPTYYPSTVHYQPSYPQLSQQYFPQSYAPHYMESPAHRSHGPPQPVHTPLESYSRRYTDTTVGSGGGTSRMGPVGGARGSGVPSQNYKQSSADNHRANLMRSPDMYAEMGIVLSQHDQVLSQDHFSESSNASRVQSPDVYPGLAPGYIEAPLRHRTIPTSPEEGPYSPQHYPTRGSGPQHSVKTSPYREQSIDNQMGYRQTNHLQSPIHYREGMTDSFSDGRYRRNSIDHQIKRSSMEIPPILPHHIRQSSGEKQLPIADHIRRTSISNQVPPNAGNYRRGSIDGQAPSNNHPGAQHQGYRDFQFRMGSGHPRNGVGDDWQHSQRDDHYGMGSQQYDRMGSLEWDDEATPTDANPGERGIDSGTTRTKVKWNTEIIEHERTPSDISDSYDL